MNVLVAAWIGSTNLGDELIAQSMFHKLRERGATPAAVSVNPTQTGTAHDVESVSHTDLIGLVRSFRSADGLVFGGGGLLQDETSFWNLPYQLSRLWLARIVGLPVGAIGLGATGLDSSLGRALVRWSLRNSLAVSVRDPESAHILASLGLPGVITSADPAIALPISEVSATDRLIVSLRPSLAPGRYLPVGARRRGGEVTAHWIGGVARALDETCRATGLSPRFVALQTDRDHELHQAVAERMTTSPELVVPTLGSVLDEVASGTAVVAMRYHAGIAALLAGRPMVLISYSPKIDSLASELGGAAALIANTGTALPRLPAELQAVMGNQELVVDARSKLRKRERANDTALDLLLERL